jgi:hypothetical protein
MNAVNRGPSGSGHGWAGVQIMFWNVRICHHMIVLPEAVLWLTLFSIMLTPSQLPPSGGFMLQMEQ